MSGPTISPVLSYADPMAGVEFLEQALGFRRKALETDDEGNVVHCELSFGDGIVMITSSKDPGFRPGQAAMYLVVEDPDARHAAAIAAGAAEVYAPRQTSYDSREFAVRDPEGNTWYLGTYQP